VRGLVALTLGAGVGLAAVAHQPSDPDPVSAADEVYPVPSTGTVTLYGHGHGHGHGMSQYGARGAALRGLTHEQVLAFYYPGTARGQLGNPTMRVRMVALDGRPLTVAAAAGLVASGGGGQRLTLPAGATQWRAVPSGGAFALQRLVGGAWQAYTVLPGPVTFSGPATQRVLFGRGKGDCRGATEVTYAGQARTLLYGNLAYSLALVPMEEYLRGVVPSEMPASWPAAALQAQSVAARSYAASRMSASRFYDAKDTTADQCWDGRVAEQPGATSAVVATAGQVRTYAGRPIFAQFSASDGGWTSSGGLPYLTAHPDPYEQYSSNPNSTWTKVVTPASLAALDGSGGVATVTALRITARTGHGDWGGRVVTMVLEGRSASGAAARSTVTGERARTGLGLKSTWFSLRPPGATAPPVRRGAQPAVWSPATGVWTSESGTPVPFGMRGDVPVAADWTGDGRTDIAVWRPSTGVWWIRGGPTIRYGQAGDIPVAADWTGDGKADLAVWRPSTGTFYVRFLTPVRWGEPGDVPVAADWTGDGRADAAVWRSGTWYVRGRSPVLYGQAGDVPLPGDHTGDGRADPAVWRPGGPGVATWYVLGEAPFRYGTYGDVPVVADWSGDRTVDIALWRPSNGQWWVHGYGPTALGHSADVATPLR